MRAAKRAARSELSVSGGEWRKRRHAESTVLSTEGVRDSLERVHGPDLTVREFEERYERPKKPVVITGLSDAWRATTEWTEEKMLQRYGDHRFKVSHIHAPLLADTPRFWRSS